MFNWLFARHHGGRALLRIEDTDKARSTPEAIDAIFAGLDWLGLDWDDTPVFQSERAARHAEVARQLLDAGLPADYADFLLQILGFFKLGYSAAISPSVQDILGRAPIRFEDYAQAQRAAWAV